MSLLVCVITGCGKRRAEYRPDGLTLCAEHAASWEASKEYPRGRTALMDWVRRTEAELRNGRPPSNGANGVKR